MIEFGIVERPCRGETVSGDAFFVRERDGKTLLGVVDGLGHSQGAALVARKAIHYLEVQHREGLMEIIQGCHQALKRTRGVAMALALVDHAVSTLTYAGVGNTCIRVVAGATSISLVSTSGIVGGNLPRLREERTAIRPGDLVIMHSDGVSARFSLADYPGLVRKEPQQIAAAIVQDFARRHDDAVLLVARL